MRWFESAYSGSCGTCPGNRCTRQGFDLKGRYVFVSCPARYVTPFHREAWEWFRLTHYRSPNVPGQRWERTATMDELSRFPARMLDAFELIENETYLLAQDMKPKE